MTVAIQISVRSLVEYVFSSGSIDTGFRSAKALTDGTKAHQKLQKEYGPGDEHEVYVSADIAHEGLVFTVDGRCDGLLLDEDGETLIVDEIKSTSLGLDTIPEDGYLVHWAQAKCYAYMIAKERGLSRMAIRLTYFQVESEEVRRMTVYANVGELEQFVHDCVAGYYPYARLQTANREQRDGSAGELAFPFPNYREGQRKLAGAVYQTIKEGHKLFAKAPTGIGKTMSTLFPAVKSFGAGGVQRIFYLTAKTITRTAAEEALALLETRGLKLRAVTLTAKEKMCLKDEVRCTPEYCEFADGYYDRVNEAVLDMLGHETLMTREVITAYARKHRVCPFEFSLDVAYAADAVICDYNYIFDPRVNLKRLFDEHKKGTVLLIDEAHNLIDRAREMYSAELTKSPFLALQRAYKGVRPELADAAKGLNNYFIALRKRCGEESRVDVELPTDLIALLEVFLAAAEQEMALGAAAGGAGDEAEAETAAALREAFFAAHNFVRIAGLYDERYMTLSSVDRSEVSVKLLCLDPSHLLGVMGKGYRSQILFSATLSPLSYYMDMLGAGENGYSITVPSPFSREQLDVKVQPVSTRYQDRERSSGKIAQTIVKLVTERAGNYLVFLPSYAYMSVVYEAFTDELMAWQNAQVEAGKPDGQPELDVWVQQAKMSEEEREQFLAAFQADSAKTTVGFAVMGGIFSEGIDLVGDRLTGVVIVGVGMPQLGPERNLIKDYMDTEGKNGFDYAYVYPGMNKVLQAGGRLIRSETDHGVLLLIDDRYVQPRYRSLLPEEWRDYELLPARG
ncbi:ATP-dependent DNA helicase [Paenibacillus whitsoniae]|uniref:ATP-dependent DNA helicase n=1 Tax=Paenibacillus whitsoniae TaxID=2496558 RepID=A0A430JCC7_9BACL|nr:ATP-dependent DNA helicase [Paenibacillus whitsoniae]RTE08706.1 ATP-dependent DNA helicase [Paenibacillus whitsoniae]